MPVGRVHARLNLGQGLAYFRILEWTEAVIVQQLQPRSLISPTPFLPACFLASSISTLGSPFHIYPVSNSTEFALSL